jgi:protein TonB
MMGNRKLFYISWLIAIVIYSFIPLTIGYYLVKKDEKAVTYTVKAETYYTIEFEEIPKKRDEKLIVKKKDNKPKIEEKKMLKKEGSLSPKEKTNFKSLFKNLDQDVKKVSKENKVETNSRTEVASRKYGQKRDNKNEAQALNDILKKMDNIKKQSIIDKSTGEFNVYYAKIKTLLTTQFNAFMKTKSDSLATVNIEIDNLGNFEFSIVKLSNDTAFNQQLKDFLELMKTKKFPPYTEGVKTEIEIEFKTEE